MKEFETSPIILNKGLRRFKSVRNGGELDGCHNLMPTDGGLRVHELIVDLDSTGTTWDGLGKLDRPMINDALTINITTFISMESIGTVAVSLDGVAKGTTDSDGNITIADVTIGIHDLVLTKAGITGSASDVIYNEYIIVEPIKEVTINIDDVYTDENLKGVSVYVDGKYMGISDVAGNVRCWLRPGVHKLRLIGSSHKDSMDDILINDYITVS